MTKQKRTDRGPEKPEVAPSGPEHAPQIDPLMAEQGAVGNEALQSLLEGESAHEPQVAIDVVRDVALPMVERAVLALELATVAAGRPARFVEILEASQLPEDRKQILIDKLQTDRSVVEAIDVALARWFTDDVAPRDVSAALDATWAGLAEGTATPDGWQVGTHEAPLSEGARQGAVAARAEALLGDVAALVVPGGPAREGAVGGISEAVRGVCRDVVLAFAFDEDEEEEETVGWEMGAQEG